MGAVSKTILLSKTFWTAVMGAIVAAVDAAGYHITTAQLDPAIDLGMFFLTGFFRIRAAQQAHVTGPEAPGSVSPPTVS